MFSDDTRGAQGLLKTVLRYHFWWCSGPYVVPGIEQGLTVWKASTFTPLLSLLLWGLVFYYLVTGSLIAIGIFSLLNSSHTTLSPNLEHLYTSVYCFSVLGSSEGSLSLQVYWSSLGSVTGSWWCLGGWHFSSEEEKPSWRTVLKMLGRQSFLFCGSEVSVRREGILLHGLRLLLHMTMDFSFSWEALFIHLCLPMVVGWGRMRKLCYIPCAMC